MKRILVTGSNGQLGNELRDLAHEYTGLEMIFTDLPGLDITDQFAVESFIAAHSPDFLINCAAYTAVDKAESEPEKALALNAEAPGTLAKLARKYSFKMIHISTDYVFNGKNYVPYMESDMPDPESAYGKSKLAGEHAILGSGSDALIIRTSWLYSAYGHNFMKTILRVAKEKNEISVVYDQVGTPTYAADLARAILEIVVKHDFVGRSVYNYSNEGVCSWYDFAKAIIYLSGLSCNVLPIRSDAYPTSAPRPSYSVLDKTKIKNEFNITIPWWKDSLSQCLKKIENNNFE